jgi:DNA polymerase-3 subunit delta'
MENGVFPWQGESWRQLQAGKDKLPHAILFHGAAGTGKTAFAERFAQSLLCEAPRADGHACDQCQACGWFMQASHPDFRRVRPEALEEADGEEAGDGDEAKKSAKSAKAPSKDIRIDQIRGLADFMNVSTHRRGKRVVMLYPAESLNAASANALLKTLEEPPPNTVFLLISNSLDRLLPTILSRCRKFGLPLPSSDQALAWLRAQGVKDAEVWLAEQGGAPLAALEMAQSGLREALEELLRHLSAPSVEDALRTADRMQKTPVAQQVEWLQRWMYDLFSVKLSGKIRYYPRYAKALTALGTRTDAERLAAALKAVNARRAIAEHPLSPKLFIEDMLLEYSALYQP